MGLNDIGNLLCLPIDEIQARPCPETHEFLVQASVQLLQETERNWVPLIVKETDVDQYEVIGNKHIYTAIVEANLSEAWCILADDSPEIEESVAILSQDVFPKINITTATPQQIESALGYLKIQANSPLKNIDISTTTKRIEKAPRQYWETLYPITMLQCKIGNGSKLEALKHVFYAKPLDLPSEMVDRTSLSQNSLTKLKKIARQRGVAGYSKLKKVDLIERLAMA